MCVYRGGGGEWPASPLQPAVAGRGSHAGQLTRGAVQLIHVYVIFALATSHPDNMFLKIVVKS